MSVLPVAVRAGAVVPFASRRRWYESRRTQAPSPSYLRWKRVMDVALVVAASPLVVPLLALCVLAIRLDSPGPALFVQLRTGRGGKRFRMHKLRTMVSDADRRKDDCMHLNQHVWPDFKIDDDPRVTRVGRFLRRTSLDELPQLLDVLRGDMSLVGPRPTSFGSETYRLWHTARLESLPGLTGLWQVSGRADLEFDDRVRLDIAYHRNRSLRLDLGILMRTLPCVLSGRGAH
jgi:lipopolysaccharide/colanic/teichoic acid biosynthesis glycosyltransferase